MARIEVTQADYWHIVLDGSRKDVKKALDVFPSPTITQNKGLFHKNVRAYHSGGAVISTGQRTGESCLECQFPNFENIPGLKHYTPIVSAGFRFDRHFDSEHSARMMIAIFRDTGFDFSDSCQGEIVRGKRINGRNYWSETPEYYYVKGIVSSKDFKRVLKAYQDFKEIGGAVGDIYVSPFNNFKLESDRVL